MNGKWRRIMISRFAENVWDLLAIFNCLGYMVLFVVVMVWLRLMLQVVEDALAPVARRHTFVHPLPGTERTKTPTVAGISISASHALEGVSQDKCA